MAGRAPYEVQTDAGIAVTLPSGATYSVMTDEEQRYLEDKITRYLNDNHFCLPAGELITTAEGPLAIEDLTTGTRVLGLNEPGSALQWQDVQLLHSLPPQPVIRLTTGNRTLRCSPGHQVLVRSHERGYRNQWKRADTVCRGDVLAVQQGSPDDTGGLPGLEPDFDRYGKGGIAPTHTVYAKVLDVSQEAPEAMFDLVVSDGHSFVASGVVTHNTNVSDMQDIDKMIVFELLIHRWSLWLSRGRDYYEEDINIRNYADMVNSYSTEIRMLKKALGVDKTTRDRTRGDDSIPALWDNLLRRAREFGYKRNEEFYQVITSFQRIKAILILHQNCDEIERKENACETGDVLDVIREEIAKFDAIDEKFRHTKQSTWIRSQ